MKLFKHRDDARKWAQYKYPQKFGQGVIVQRYFGALIDCEPGWYNVDVVTGKVL